MKGELKDILTIKLDNIIVFKKAKIVKVDKAK